MSFIQKNTSVLVHNHHKLPKKVLYYQFIVTLQRNFSSDTDLLRFTINIIEHTQFDFALMVFYGTSGFKMKITVADQTFDLLYQKSKLKATCVQ